MQLTIAGLGIQGVNQITQEAIAAIRWANKVAYVPADVEALAKLFETLDITGAENLLPLYRDDDVDSDNYKRILKKVISLCKQHKKVTLLMPGNPRVGASYVQWLESCKERLGLELRVLPGVSSFAAMANDLKRDPLERGSAIVDANRLLLFGYQMEPAMDYYIYHVCSVGTSRIHMAEPSKENRLELLQSHLLKFYKASHPVTLIESAQTNSVQSFVVQATLGTLKTLLPVLKFGTTLFVPAAAPSKIDEKYLSLLGETA
jgi:uncharacterized protein YabN with tetrapyrrole methylase and pyrophosphatase domain